MIYSEVKFRNFTLDPTSLPPLVSRSFWPDDWAIVWVRGSRHEILKWCRANALGAFDAVDFKGEVVVAFASEDDAVIFRLSYVEPEGIVFI